MRTGTTRPTRAPFCGRSVAPESGKTRLLETIEPLVPRPWTDIRPSEAVLFRRTHRDHPTVLLDEIDAVFKDRSSQFEGLRADLNAGNRRGVTVSRWNTARNDLDSFEIYTPKAIAGLGNVPDTVATRAIPIVMRRRTKTERVERLRSRRARELGHPLRDAVAAHVSSLDTLTLPDDALPDELSDRQLDSWEPLLAIADAAGGAWPEQARRAAVGLHSEPDTIDEQDYGIRLLADTRSVFAQSDSWLKTADLIHELANVEESPWGDIRDKPISAHYLAKLLRGFGIQAHTPAGWVSNPAWLRSGAICGSMVPIPAPYLRRKWHKRHIKPICGARCAGCAGCAGQRGATEPNPRPRACDPLPQPRVALRLGETGRQVGEIPLLIEPKRDSLPA